MGGTKSSQPVQKPEFYKSKQSFYLPFAWAWFRRRGKAGTISLYPEKEKTGGRDGPGSRERFTV